VAAVWQNDFCLLFELIKISDCLAWEQYKLAQVCALNSNLILEWAQWKH